MKENEYWILTIVQVARTDQQIVTDSASIVYPELTSSLPITSGSNGNCIIVLISVQYKAPCLLLAMILDPGIQCAFCTRLGKYSIQ